MDYMENADYANYVDYVDVVDYVEVIASYKNNFDMGMDNKDMVVDR